MKNEYEAKFNALFDKYVPAEGCAETKGGELIRAVNRIGYRFFNDGDMIGIDYGNETCNAPARYVMEIYPDSEMAGIVKALWGNTSRGLYEDGVDDLVEETVKYLKNHSELFEEEVDYDYQDFEESEDKEWYEEDEEEMDDDLYSEMCYRQMMEDISQYPPLSADR